MSIKGIVLQDGDVLVGAGYGGSATARCVYNVGSDGRATYSVDGLGEFSSPTGAAVAFKRSHGAENGQASTNGLEYWTREGDAKASRSDSSATKAAGARVPSTPVVRADQAGLLTRLLNAEGDDGIAEALTALIGRDVPESELAQVSAEAARSALLAARSALRTLNGERQRVTSDRAVAEKRARIAALESELAALKASGCTNDLINRVMADAADAVAGGSLKAPPVSGSTDAPAGDESDTPTAGETAAIVSAAVNGTEAPKLGKAARAQARLVGAV